MRKAVGAFPFGTSITVAGVLVVTSLVQSERVDPAGYITLAFILPAVGSGILVGAFTVLVDAFKLVRKVICFKPELLHSAVRKRGSALRGFGHEVLVVGILPQSFDDEL